VTSFLTEIELNLQSRSEEMKSETIEYRDGDVRLKGFITFDAAGRANGRAFW